MKINQPPDLSIVTSSHAAALATKNGSAASTLAKSSASKSTQTAGVAVSVSSMARALEASNRSETPDVDTTKVEAVRNAIAQGTFAVNPQAIADKLLSNAQEMLTRSRA